MITIIYGENGSGKSFYGKQAEENNKNEVRVLNSSIIGWYNSENKELSEFKYLSKEYIGENEKSAKDLLSATGSSLSKIPGFKQNKFLKFLKNNSFDKKEDWLIWEPKTKSNNIDLELSVLIDLSSFINENIEQIKEIQSDYAELIALLFSIQFDVTFNEDRAQKFVKKLNALKKEIEKDLSDAGINYVFLKKIKPKEILRIFAKKPKKMTKEIINNIKDIIANSEEVKKIKNNNKKIAKIKEKSITFSPKLNKEVKKLEFEDDYKTIIIDLNIEKFSEGEKAYKVLKIIAKSLECSENKKIIFDDFFEKLDVEHQELSFLLLSELNDIEIEILTHCEKTVELFLKLKKIHQIKEIKTKKISFSSEKKYKFNDTDLNLTFNLLNEKLCDEDVFKKKNQYYGIYGIFARIFGRYLAKSGSISGCNKACKTKQYTENNNYLCFQYASENIFHYNNKINISKINEIFGLSLEENLELNSVNLINELIKLFDKHKSNSEHGISIEKIIEHLQNIKNSLNLEKKYFESTDLPSVSLKKNKFYENFWKRKEKIKPSEKAAKDRKNIVHLFDNTLISIQE